MQNLFIATIIVLTELSVLGLVGIFLFFLARRHPLGKRHDEARTQELKLLSHHLVLAHDALLKHHQEFIEASSRASDAKPLPPSLEKLLRKAISHLRASASQLALGQISPLQVTQSLLTVQEALLAALREPYNSSGQKTARAEVQPERVNQPVPGPVALDPDRTEIIDVAEKDNKPEEAQPLPPIAPPPQKVSTPETKSDAELQAEIDDMMNGEATVADHQPVAAAQPEQKPEADSVAQKMAPVAPAVPENRPRGAAEGPEVAVGLSNDELEAELDALLGGGPKKPAAAPAAPPAAPKMTEAEIEAEMQAELDALLNGGPQNPAPAPAPAPAAPPAAPKMTEAEIEAEMQAELEMFNASQGSTKGATSNDDLQAELDALLNGGGPKTPATAPAAPPAAPKMTEAEIEAEMQAELEMFNASQGSTKGATSNDDLQAELDALLNGGGSKKPAPAAPPAAPKMTEAEIEAEMQAELEMFNASQGSTKGATSNDDLQAELDALLNGGGLKTPAPAPAAPPAAPKMTEAEIEAEMQAELEMFNASQGSTKGATSNEDLQAELDALLR